MMNEKHAASGKPGPLRLFAVMLYDTMLLVSVLMVASAVAVALNGGEAIGANNPFFLFICWEWRLSFMAGSGRMADKHWACERGRSISSAITRLALTGSRHFCVLSWAFFHGCHWDWDTGGYGLAPTN